MSRSVLKFALASYGSRGDVESCAAVGRELLHRGHQVTMAAPPNLRALVESAGIATVSFGLDSKTDMAPYRNLWTSVFHNFWKAREVARLWREANDLVVLCGTQVNETLMSLADGADLLFTGLAYEEQAANVAELQAIPFATLHFFPVRANGRAVPVLPPTVTRVAMTGFDWLSWRLTKRAADAQRRAMGLPATLASLPHRIARRGGLEIQAYDDAWFPGLAAEWAQWTAQRPFVGTLTLELPTENDDDVMSWIAAGTPPIYFGFGSIPVGSPADTLGMIATACARLGERALVCGGWSDFSEFGASFDHVKVVEEVNHAAVFPACRAVVHHGGAGTTAAGMRAGVPALILWTLPDQPVWGARVKRLGVGDSRRFSTTSVDTLTADLRRVLQPHCASNARQFATRLARPAAAAAKAADLLEERARVGALGG